MGKLVAPPVETAESTIHFPMDGQFFEGLTEAHLHHALTPRELAAFQRDGYLVVPEALDPGTLIRLREAVDRLDERERRRLGLAPGDMMSRFSVIRFDPAFLGLVAWRRTFPKVWDILGWNIQLYISHLVVYPPETWGAGSAGPRSGTRTAAVRCSSWNAPRPGCRSRSATGSPTPAGRTEAPWK